MIATYCLVKLHRLKVQDKPATEEDTHMADSGPHPDFSGDPEVGTGGPARRGSAPSTPRWVKVFGVIVVVLVVVLVIVHLAGGGMGSHG